MLKCVKYCAMVSFLSMLLIVAIVSPASAATEAVSTFVDSSWTNVVYYIAELSGYDGILDGYNDITINITAVDEYELYVNGVVQSDANDGDYLTVDEHTVNVLDANSVLVGVKVTNHGLGLGNGLIVDIEAATDMIGSTSQMRKSMGIPVGNLDQDVPVAWWSFDSETKNDPNKLALGDDDWYKFTGSWFGDSKYNTHMRRVYKGEFKGAMKDIAHVFNPGIEVITGYLHSDVDIDYDAEGGIALRSIEGENIALNKPADEFQLTDGIVGNKFDYTANVLSDTKQIDLGSIYRVNKMTVFTGGGDAQSFVDVSFRGYSVEISLDRYRWEEVGIIHDIGKENSKGETNLGGFDNYSVDFPPEWARYVRYKITETRTDNPDVGEVMVFGQGYVLESKYVSPWHDFGAPDQVKNFGMITWSGEQPDGTEIIVQTQTKNGVDGLPSVWGSESKSGDNGRVEETFLSDSPEPATHFRYRVTLKTEDLLQTPVFREFTLDYSGTDQPVSSAVGYVTPERVAMGEDVNYVYTLDYDINTSAAASSQNVKSIAISVPGYSVPSYAYSVDGGDTLVVGDGISYTSTIDTLYVTFDTPETDTDADGSGTIEISFNTKLLRSSHTFDAYISNSSMNDGIGGIKVWENTAAGTNSVVVSTLIKSILSDVKAVPKVFTPNSDGKNDFTVIQFTLAKVSTDITLKIYSPNGSLVTTVLDGEYYTPSEFVADAGDINGAMSMPGYWDGKDEDDELVPPGIYIYQVIADTDEGDVIEAGSVVVAY